MQQQQQQHQQQPDRCSELIPVPVWIVSRGQERHRLLRQTDAEIMPGRQGRLGVSRHESMVTVICRKIFRKAARRDALPDFSKHARMGIYLDRVWKALMDATSRDFAQDAFTGKDQCLGVVTGLALLSIQHLEFGPLALLDWEERFLWEYFNRQPCVFLKVEAFCNLLDVDSNNRRATLQDLRPNMLCSLHAEVKESLLSLPQVQAFLAENQIQPGVVSGKALQAWAPIAHLVAFNRWTFLGFGGMVRNLPAQTLPQLKLAWRNACRLHVAGAGPGQDDGRGVLQNPHGLRDIAQNVRAWACHLLHGRAVQEGGKDEQRFLLESCVQLFEREADALEVQQNPWMESFGRFGFQKRYKMVQLLRLVLLVRDVRTATKTKQVLLSALGAVLPGESVQYFERMIADEDVVPSKTVLYNMRFVVDMALMLHTRTWLRANFQVDAVNAEIDMWHMWSTDMPAVYLLADSSPQGGRNLLNSEYHMVLAQDLFKLHQVFFAIQETLRALGDDSLTDDELKGFLEEHDTLVATGEKLIKHHANIPVVLGSGHATLIHEFVALQHAVFMETGCSSTLATWNQCVVSTTTDRGVEKGLNKVGPLSFSQAFPYFLGSQDPAQPAGDMDLDFEVDVGGVAEIAQRGQEADPQRNEPMHPHARIQGDVKLHLNKALDVAGAMHSLHNISKGFLNSMPNYDQHYWPMLQGLTRFLYAPYYRERFCQKCLVGNLEPMRDLLDSFPHTLVKWRWLTITSVVPAVLELEHALVAGWDADRMAVRLAGVGGDVADQGEEDDYHNMSWDIVDKAIKSTAFWAWLRMLLLLTSVMGYLERWFFGCACHFEPPTMQNLLRVVSISIVQQQPRRRGRQQDQRQQSTVTCPFRQRRGPELASGDFLSMVELLLTASSQEVVAVVIPRCDAQGQARISEDFDCARNHLSFHLKAQFAPWSTLPRVLLGLMHPNEEKARACAVKALTEYSEWLPQQRDASHFIVKGFLSPTGSLRNLLCRFVAGEALTSLHCSTSMSSGWACFQRLKSVWKGCML